MPMQPSTHVTHMPEAGTIDPSVRFFVSVAADVLVLESDIGLVSLFSPDQLFRISQATHGDMKHIMSSNSGLSRHGGLRFAHAPQIALSGAVQVERHWEPRPT